MSRDFIYEKVIRPIFFKLDPESVHHFATFIMKGLAPCGSFLPYKYEKDDLRTEFFGSIVQVPIGLAAGFDKNAELLSLLGAYGFGFAEIGSVCARPHGGNPRPRLFRLSEDEALINRLGLNSMGVEVVASHLESLETNKQVSELIPYGINIAKTNDPAITGEAASQDIFYSYSRLKNLNAKYITINSSCPNTHEGCVTELEQIARVLDKINPKQEKLPVLLKLSPDSEDSFLKELVRLSISYKLAGYVCGNTTVSRDSLKSTQERLAEIGKGGLSGKPLKALNLRLTEKIAALKTEEQIIISAGGIASGLDAFEYLSAGAQLLQIYTGFVYRGPAAVRIISEELSEILKSKGLKLKDLQSGKVSI